MAKWYPNGLWSFSMPIEDAASWPCVVVGGSGGHRDWARIEAADRLGDRLGRYVDEGELDAGVWVMPEVQ
jgi:hypothetical protein